jgi:hypothetical protein
MDIQRAAKQEQQQERKRRQSTTPTSNKTASPIMQKQKTLFSNFGKTHNKSNENIHTHNKTPCF